MDDRDEWWESENSVLEARHDDDEDVFNIIYKKVKLATLVEGY